MAAPEFISSPGSPISCIVTLGKEEEGKVHSLPSRRIPGVNNLRFSSFFKTIIIIDLGVPTVAQWLPNPTRNHEVGGSICGLVLWGFNLWPRSVG